MTFLLRLLMVLAGTALWFGLAIAGIGGFTAFLSHPALQALLPAYLVIAVFGAWAGGNLSGGVKEDRGNRWVLAAFTLIGLLIGFVPAWTDRFDYLSIDGETVRWVGVVLTIAGAVLRIWPVRVLGNRFSGLVAIQQGHTLVTTGIYRTIRNPSYLGLLINCAGWSLAFRSTIGLLLVAALLPPLIVRMKSEERLLQAQFGAEYEAYRARTWRLVPGIY